MSDKYKRIDIRIICKILKYLKSGSKRVLRLQQYCRINSNTCDNHLDFFVKMSWVKDIKEHRCRTIEITEEGRKYEEKFCNRYEFKDDDDDNYDQ